jgi:hypothetical protein
MRFKRLMVTTAGVGLVLVGVAAPSQAQLTTFCDGTASGVTIPGDLVVRADASCELTDVVIQGNATVRAGANLLLTDTSVAGNLVVQANGFASVVDSSVVGTTRLNSAFGVYAEGSELTGAVTAAGPEFFYSLDTVHGANVTSTDGETFIESGWVARNVTTTGDLLTDVYDTVVERSLSVTGAEWGSVVCGSEIDGAATFTGNSDLVQIGAGTVSGCEFNVFGDSVSVTGTSGDSFVTGNVIRGDLTCSGNDPATVASGNRVRGNEDCGSAAMTTFSRGAQIDADVRKAEVLEKIDERTDAGEQAAEDAGPAFE